MLNRYIKHVSDFNIHSLIADGKRELDMLKHRAIRYINSHRDIKYLTVYRALLAGLLLPGIVMMLIGGTPRKLFVTAWGALLVLTFLVEILSFVFQLSRKENFWAEVGLLIVFMIGAFVFM